MEILSASFRVLSIIILVIFVSGRRFQTSTMSSTIYLSVERVVVLFLELCIFSFLRSECLFLLLFSGLGLWFFYYITHVMCGI